MLTPSRLCDLFRHGQPAGSCWQSLQSHRVAGLQGFWSAASGDLLRSWQVSSADLQAIASGSGQVKDGCSRRLQEVFRVVLDPELRGQSSLLAECFWEV